MSSHTPPNNPDHNSLADADSGQAFVTVTYKVISEEDLTATIDVEHFEKSTGIPLREADVDTIDTYIHVTHPGLNYAITGEEIVDSRATSVSVAAIVR